MQFFASTTDDIPNEELERPYIVRSRLRSDEQVGLRSSLCSYKSVVSGLERYHVGDEDILLRGGQAFVAPSNEDIDVIIEREAVGVCLYFPLDEFIDHLSGASSENLDRDGADLSNVFGLRLPSLLSSASAPDSLSHPIDIDAFLACLAEQVARAHGLFSGLNIGRPCVARELTSRLEIARDFILSNLMEPLTLGQVSEAACLSRFHLTRQFACAYGDPPLRFHQRHRMLAARRRLHSGEPVAYVSEALKFSETAAFSRAYKRIMGKVPSSEKSNLDQP